MQFSCLTTTLVAQQSQQNYDLRHTTTVLRSQLPMAWYNMSPKFVGRVNGAHQGAQHKDPD